MIFVSYDKCRSGKLFKPSCNSLHHTNLAEFHINAPANKRLFYLIHKLTAVDKKKHSLAVKGRSPCHFSHNAGLSATAGQDYAGCFIPCTPSLPYLLHQLILIRSQFHWTSPPLPFSKRISCKAVCRNSSSSRL